MPLAPETGWPVSVAAVDWNVPAHLSANVAVPTAGGGHRPSGCEGCSTKAPLARPGPQAGPRGAP